MERSTETTRDDPDGEYLKRNREMLWGGRREMATSSLHVTDGVPRCPSRTT